MAAFRVAIDGAFVKPDGTPTYPDFDLGPLRAAPGIEAVSVELGDECRPEALAGFDALILLLARFTRASVPDNGRMRIIARFGVGYDTVDVAACTDAGIALTITPSGVRRPVAVAILTLVLALAGKLMDKDRLTRLGPDGYARRSAFMGTGLIGRTLASIGVGNIGSEMFRIAAPLGMRFIAHDPYVDPVAVADLGVTLTDLETVFREADFLAVNCPLSPETRHMVDAGRIALMKPTAYLINTARGPIVDQAALTEALVARRIAGAGLDVQEQEPPDPADPLLRLDNVILTPHALCWTDQCFAGIGASAVRSVLDVAEGRVPGGLVNQAVLGHPRWKDARADAAG
ncbi:MAG TPA: NAD(P)-dependent oxidoreductase [Acetobacteraceae bacterium]|nr:NAD(P)-dependent oxidoreductase [Acetobacteraceae bacterium]